MLRLASIRWLIVCVSLGLSACSGGPAGTGEGNVKPGDGEDGGQRDASDDPDADDEFDGGWDGWDGGGGDVDGDVDAESDAAPVCKTECEADDCGEYVSDNCGGHLECGTTCPEGQGCGLVRPDKCDAPPSSCTPKTEAEACAGKCGVVSDGCNSVFACTAANGGVSCGADQHCVETDGANDRNSCVANPPSCVPQTCAQQGVACGPAGDGCGNILDCTAITGGCTGDQVCGTGASSGDCVDPPPPACEPMAIAEACQGTCGTVDDGCGTAINCESSPLTACPTGQTCGGGGTPGQCGSGTVCTPIAVATACAGKCGSVSNGCDGSYTCNAGNGGDTCDSTLAEECIAGTCTAPVCTPRTFAQACPGGGGHKSCGVQPDGCNSTINCGGCAADESCGRGGPSLCGPNPVCQPTPAATACAGKCGTVANGCGGTIACNSSNGGVSCTGSEYCGATQPNRCGTPPVTCTPRSCAQLGHSCGLASDGCGHQLNCWSGCSPSDPSCTGSCGGNSGCLANTTTGAQSCVVGSPACSGSLCNTVPTSCGTPTATKLTGTVRTPGFNNSGTWVNRLPVPNALVYIPAEPTTPLPTLFEGVQAGNPASCGRCEDEALVADGQSVLAAAVSDFKGEFTLEGRIPVGTAFELVIKVGKWRRVIQVPAGVAQACTSQPLALDYTRLPAFTNDGLSGTHLPKIAISTGAVDEMECVFRAIGMAETEFTVPSGGGRIHMYRATGSGGNGANGGARMRQSAPGCTGTWNPPGPNNNGTQCTANNNAGCSPVMQPGCSGTVYTDITVDDSALYNTPTTLDDYDLVVWDCEGNEAFEGNTARANIESYVNAGGRMFASHFSYTWVEGNGTLDASADWGASGSVDDAIGFISLPSGSTQRTRANAVKSPLFRDWLDWQGALTGTTAGMLTNPATPQFPIEDARDRAGANVGASTDEWVYRLSGANPRVQQLSFNTPYGAAENLICGRVAYSGFHVSDTDNNDSNDYFPGVCDNGELSAQEKILAFMLFDLATCVSTGDPPTPPSCIPKTTAQLCPNVNDACGFLSDGCGGVVDCAGCSAGFYCDGNSCRPQECTPTTCAALGFNCGEHADGCGGIARNAQGVESCGECVDGQICGLGGPGLCGGNNCTPIDVNVACPPNSCGIVSNGCGGTFNCGACPVGQVCGGGGANLCGEGVCTEIPRATACANKNCGFASDGCGGSYNCGDCVPPDTCGGGGQANVCGHPQCVPFTQQQACNGKQCGWVSDGCGGAIQCGTCPDGGVCGGAGPNQCGSSCTPTSCVTEGAECGAISDECGGVLSCGNCPPGQICGAAGPNKCGTGQTCVERNCTQAGAQCGLVGDGCGGVLDCGNCMTAGQTCGGAGVANQCGTGTGGCNKLTCDVQSVDCGAASDGCGGLLDCGGCEPGYTCERGDCVELPPVLN
jgi:hypothetical protein